MCGYGNGVAAGGAGADFQIISVTDRRTCAGDFCSRIAELAAAGVSAVILREKDLQPSEYEALAADVKKICVGAGMRFIAHSFIDCAVNIGCRNIHLPMPLFRKFSERAGFYESFDEAGASVHSLEEAFEAQSLGASYVTVGHVFATDCKAGLAPRGLGFLREIAQALDIPVYAIGGVNAGNIAGVRNAGAQGACIMSGFMTASDVKGYMRALTEGLST